MSLAALGTCCSAAKDEEGQRQRLQETETERGRAEEECSSSTAAAEQEQGVDEAVGRKHSEASLCTTPSAHEDEEEEAPPMDIDLGPRLSIKEQLDKDKVKVKQVDFLADAIRSTA